MHETSVYGIGLYCVYMLDLKNLGLELLETEKRFLLEENDDYVAAVVVVVTSEGRYWEDVTFDDEEEMDQAYIGVVTRAKENSALAIITVNMCRERLVADDETLEGYWWRQLASEGCGRALTLTASGPEIEPWILSLPFRVEDGEVIFDQMTEFQPARIGLLPNWP